MLGGWIPWIRYAEIIPNKQPPKREEFHGIAILSITKRREHDALDAWQQPLLKL